MTAGVTGVVTTSFPRWPGDFAGAFVLDRVEALRAAGETVEVIAAGPGESSPALTRLPASFAGGPSLFEGAGAPEALERGGAAVHLAAARFVVELASAVRRCAPRWARVESHWLAPCGLAAMAAAPGLPHRAWAHSGDVALLERIRFGRTLARRLAAGATELVFASEALRRRFAALAGVLRGRVEPLTPPATLFARAYQPAPAGAALRTRVLSVGRLVPIKGFDLLLHACARAGARDVTVLGDGPERGRLRALAARLGLSLRLPGVVPRPEVAAWMRAAEVYVQPSRALAMRTEGTPVATLEAIAVGIPVIASDSGGLAELGIPLFPAGDIGALAAKLREMLLPHPSNARVT
jgi:hypothetical protein